MTLRARVAAAVILATGACGGATASSSTQTRESAPSRGGAMAASLDGTWAGYIESYKFPSGSDAIAATLTLHGTTVTGTMVFGNGPALAPATDPNVGYPANVSFDNAHRFAGERFVYTIVGGTFDGTRLQIGVKTRELWTGWCALQKPIPDQAGGAYGCLANWGFGQTHGSCMQTDPTTSVPVAVDCGKLFLCAREHVCQCTASACSAAPTAADITLDVQVSGAKADGSTTGVFGDHNVHLAHGS